MTSNLIFHITADLTTLTYISFCEQLKLQTYYLMIEGPKCYAEVSIQVMKMLHQKPILETHYDGLILWRTFHNNYKAESICFSPQSLECYGLR